MDKLIGFIGLARKAGCLALGEDEIFRLAAASKIRLIIAANDISENSKNKILNLAKANNLRFITAPLDRNALGNAVGIPVCAVCAVLDTSFACEIAAKIAAVTTIPSDIEVADRLKLALKRKKERQNKNKFTAERGTV